MNFFIAFLGSSASSLLGEALAISYRACRNLGELSELWIHSRRAATAVSPTSKMCFTDKLLCHGLLHSLTWASFDLFWLDDWVELNKSNSHWAQQLFFGSMLSAVLMTSQPNSALESDKEWPWSMSTTPNNWAMTNNLVEKQESKSFLMEFLGSNSARHQKRSLAFEAESTLSSPKVRSRDDSSLHGGDMGLEAQPFQQVYSIFFQHFQGNASFWDVPRSKFSLSHLQNQWSTVGLFIC